MTGQSKNWVFTLNNYTQDERQSLLSIVGRHHVSWIILGYERGANGTPHIQGYVQFSRRKRLTQVKAAISPRAHVERRHGTHEQAREYCLKDGDFAEFGQPDHDGERIGNAGAFADFCNWVAEYHRDHGSNPTERAIANAFPALFVRYSRALFALSTHLCPRPQLEGGDLNDWQRELAESLGVEADDRTVSFYVDEAGGKGKSFFQRHYISEHPEEVQLLSSGKRDDIAHAIDPSKHIFLFNIPRGGMEFLQYTILEQLKDRVVFSPKYNSTTKFLMRKPHVIVFCNEYPDLNKMTMDRYDIKDMSTFD